MANPGTLEWAEQTLAEIRSAYQSFEDKAAIRQTEPMEIGGRENLKELLRKLDEIIDFASIYHIDNHLAYRLYCQALSLHRSISSWLYK